MQQNTSVDSRIGSSVQNHPRLNIGVGKSLLFEDQAAPWPQVVPRCFDGKRPIQQDLIGNFLHLANSPPQPPGGEPVWLAYLEIVKRKLFGSIGVKNLGP